MAWIRVIQEGEATGTLRQTYEKFTEPWGGVDNILKIHTLNPASLRGHYDFYTTLMRGASDLTRAQREMIGVVASTLNRCKY
jgi:alkylhydroperoxidase family enzyme